LPSVAADRVVHLALAALSRDAEMVERALRTASCPALK
jgi:hypothetical protein